MVHKMPMAVLCLAGLLFSAKSVIGQDSTSGKGLDAILNFPNKLFSKIQRKTDDLNNQLTRQSEKYLRRLERKEAKMRTALYKKDSAAAERLFSKSSEKYQSFGSQFKDSNSKVNPAHNEYLPTADSLRVSLDFLHQNPDLLNNSPTTQKLVAGNINSVNQLQGKLQCSDRLRQYLRERQEQLIGQLNQYENATIKKLLNQYNQEVFYYSQQVREYKEAFNDPDKLLQKALTVLNKIPAFQTFMKNNSQLAALFGTPGNFGSAESIIGLQSRDQIQQVMQGKLGSTDGSGGGGSGLEALQNNLASADQQLEGFQDKLSQYPGTGIGEMPNFKPNNQKTKTFLRRLEFGVNVQTTQSSYFFPITTDFGVSIGYKISNKVTAGIGGSYNVGWGSGFNHIKLSSQGASIRTFMDIQVKSNFYASGGMEFNYAKPFTNFQQIRSLSDWQQSGLIGVTKAVSFSGGVIKKTRLQLFWDFLSYYQIPKTQPLIFRVGYGF